MAGSRMAVSCWLSTARALREFQRPETSSRRLARKTLLLAWKNLSTALVKMGVVPLRTQETRSWVIDCRSISDDIGTKATQRWKFRTRVSNWDCGWGRGF
jgi:hypothetical protein